MTAVVLFTRDLRVDDQPALARACRTHAEVLPLFVLDERVLIARTASLNRATFLSDAVADLRRSLRDRGGDLVIRRGDVVAETVQTAHACGASAVFASADVSAYAQRRERQLAAACDQAGLTVEFLPGVTVVPPGAVRPAGADHYRVFTPYYRAWRVAQCGRLSRLPGQCGCRAVPSLPVPCPARRTWWRVNARRGCRREASRLAGGCWRRPSGGLVPADPTGTTWRATTRRG